MTHVSLFSGIGGLDLAAEWAGFDTVLFCEKDPYCQKVLARHWPGVPIIDDIRSVKRESISGAVDVISGGFPCQPFSHAGKRGGTGDDRYLWPQMLRVIRELKPRWVVAENVPGLLSIDAGLVFETVLSGLEALGYETYPACGVGAPHRRDRVFIVAHCLRAGLEGHSGNGGGRDEPGRDSAETGRSACPGGICADVADGKRMRELQPEGREQEQRRRISDGREEESLHQDNGIKQSVGMGERTQSSKAVRDILADAEERGRGEGYQDAGGRGAGTGEKERPRLVGSSRREAKRGLGGMADEFPGWLDEPAGIPRVSTGDKNRVNRLKSLGNAVVPQQAYPIFAAIAATEQQGREE